MLPAFPPLRSNETRSPKTLDREKCGTAPVFAGRLRPQPSLGKWDLSVMLGSWTVSVSEATLASSSEGYDLDLRAKVGGLLGSDGPVSLPVNAGGEGGTPRIAK